jgi:hypothetical protein
VAIGGHDLLLPPAVAALLHAQAATARSVSPLARTTGKSPAWLFPGGPDRARR